LNLSVLDTALNT